MTKVIIASVIMASVTYGKCYLWQKYYGKCNYGKSIMANETEPIFLHYSELGTYVVDTHNPDYLILISTVGLLT